MMYVYTLDVSCHLSCHTYGNDNDDDDDVCKFLNSTNSQTNKEKAHLKCCYKTDLGTYKA